jgi:molybdate transport system substrate-binding protein
MRAIQRPIGLAAAAIVSLWFASATSIAQTPLTVVAAADLQTVLPMIAAQFEKDTGSKVALTFGASGTLFAQIQNGAPFDVFLSADIDYPKRLEAAGLGEPGTLYEYATGHLVLWTRTDSGVDVRAGLPVLTTAAVTKIAVANPQTAPYGRAAVAALRHEGLYDRLQPKFVLGENIAQTAQYVQAGSAQVGLLSLSLALSPTLKAAGTYAEVPSSFYPPIEQGAIVVAASKQKAIARQFLEHLKKPSTAQTFQAFGFGLPVALSRFSWAR